MLRYEQPVFAAVSELMQAVGIELNEYEDEMRRLSGVWDAEPDTPAPRQRLRQEIGRLEQREAVLTLMQRRLGTIAKAYEAAEHRILAMAETESVQGAERVSSGKNQAESGNSIQDAKDGITGIPSIDLSKWFVRGSLINWRPLPPGPAPHPSPFPSVWPSPVRPPRPAVHRWPPRRPPVLDRITLIVVLTEIVRRLVKEGKIMRMATGYLPMPVILPGPAKGKMTVPTIRSVSCESEWNQAMRSRITTLFSSDRV